jgi:hypothetical protein
MNYYIIKPINYVRCQCDLLEFFLSRQCRKCNFEKLPTTALSALLITLDRFLFHEIDYTGIYRADFTLQLIIIIYQ